MDDFDAMDYEALIEALTALCRKTGMDRKKRFDDIYAIGLRLNTLGGFSLMLSAHGAVKTALPKSRTASHLVDMTWSGIGDWRG